jgi:chemotaxis regulatin CheY-phosphate phosphatase CheZ
MVRNETTPEAVFPLAGAGWRSANPPQLVILVHRAKRDMREALDAVDRDRWGRAAERYASAVDRLAEYVIDEAETACRAVTRV